MIKELVQFSGTADAGKDSNGIWMPTAIFTVLNLST
jgi:hypothetical protein